MNNDNSIHFTDLKTWKEAHELVLMIYKMTKKFPEDEEFGLSNQIKRASVSISSNIAEGYGRNSIQEKLRFYVIAHGSLTEVQDQLLIAKDVGYISGVSFEEAYMRSIIVHKSITDLIKSTKERTRN